MENAIQNDGIEKIELEKFEELIDNAEKTDKIPQSENDIESKKTETDNMPQSNNTNITENLQLEEEPENIRDIDIAPIIESILFVSGHSVPFEKIQKIINIDLAVFRKKIQELNNIYQSNSQCFRIIEVAGGFQLVTKPEYARWIRKFFGIKKIKSLTPSALETLAIIAYKQPITKAKLESIRGVNSDAQIQQLLEKKMIQIIGRAEELGRPILYGTTVEFLEYFGLKDLKDLPDAAELDKLIALKREDEKKKVEQILLKRESKENAANSESIEETSGFLEEQQSLLRENADKKIDSIEKENNADTNIEIENSDMTIIEERKAPEKNTIVKSEDDEMLEKEYINVLMKERNIRKSMQEIFGKMESPDELKKIMEERGFKISNVPNIVDETDDISDSEI